MEVLPMVAILGVVIPERCGFTVEKEQQVWIMLRGKKVTVINKGIQSKERMYEL